MVKGNGSGEIVREREVKRKGWRERSRERKQNNNKNNSGKAHSKICPWPPCKM